jgi:hypothetical protein
MAKKPDNPNIKKRGVTNRLKPVKAEFPKIFADCMGIVTMACAKADIDYDTYQRWRKDDPEFAAKCDKAYEKAGDFVESQLYKLIQKGNTPATIFYCKTKLRNRGYVEKNETTITHLMHEQAIKELAGEELALLEDKSE